MYADRTMLSHGPNPVSLAASLAISSAIVLALVYISPDVIKKLPIPVIEGYNVREPDAPPPEPQPDPRPKTELPRDSNIVVPTPPITPPVTDNSDLRTTTVIPSEPPPFTGTLEGTGAGAIAEPEPPRPLPFLGASLDPRYANALQPEYPGSEMRSQREGRVTVRVLIGVDGRVKQIEMVSATSDAFFQATRRQALSRWRFKPATRGGIPEESWKQMSVRFELKE